MEFRNPETNDVTAFGTQQYPYSPLRNTLEPIRREQKKKRRVKKKRRKMEEEEEGRNEEMKEEEEAEIENELATTRTDKDYSD